MKEISESPHWKRTERLPGGAAAVVSIDVRHVMLAADWRRRHPALWDRAQRQAARLWDRLRARITRLSRRKKKT